MATSRVGADRRGLPGHRASPNGGGGEPRGKGRARPQRRRSSRRRLRLARLLGRRPFGTSFASEDDDSSFFTTGNASCGPSSSPRLPASHVRRDIPISGRGGGTSSGGGGTEGNAAPAEAAALTDPPRGWCPCRQRRRGPGSDERGFVLRLRSRGRGGGGGGLLSRLPLVLLPGNGGPVAARGTGPSRRYPGRGMSSQASGCSASPPPPGLETTSPGVPGRQRRPRAPGPRLPLPLPPTGGLGGGRRPPNRRHEPRSRPQRPSISPPTSGNA
jgi:hypothetical protein